MRRGSAVGLALASGLALFGGWRMGLGSSPGGVQQGLATPVPTSSTPAGTAGSSSSTTHRAPAAKSSTSPANATAQTFNGAAEQTQYGTVQVAAVIKGGKLVDVVALHLTDRDGRSVSISASAAPTLRREALAAGSARIDAVSGASYTSAGYIQSLQSALDAARAAGV